MAKALGTPAAGVRARSLAVAALVLLHFVCPLLFFTDLTRNPYLTQIALVNVLAAAALVALAAGWAASGEVRFPRTAVDRSWALWAGACGLSWLVAYAGHREFFRPAMRSEGLRAFAFLLSNAWLPFVLALAVPSEREEEAPSGWVPWAAFIVLWGGAWAMFPSLRALPGSADVWEHIWDPFGGLLWLAGAGAVLFLARRGRLMDFWHVALTAGALASAYAVLQYFNVEWIWPKALNPYGGRSVSTFGNPNFMSSYLVLLLPVSAVLYIRSAGWVGRLFYAACFWLGEAALLCSLTRSSWVGAAAALAVLALSPEVRRRLANERGLGPVLAVPAAAMVLFWPQSAVESYNPSVWGRFAEMGVMLKGPDSGVYGPWHQRLLIWSCAWQMGLENALTGKGWGLFELFYPYYQGPLLLAVDAFRQLRTHANNCHNEVLEMWSQTGLLGLGAFLGLWTAFAAAFRREAGGAGSQWRWAAFAGVAGFLVDNLLNVSLHFAVPGFLFWWQAGTALGAAESRSERWRLRRPSPAAVSALFLLVAAAGAASAWGWAAQWAREVEYFAGFKLIRQGGVAQAVKKLESAHAWHAREVNTNYELGNAYARAQEPERALWAYDEALRANAGYDEIFYNKGSLLAVRQGRHAESVPWYRMAVAINPLNKDSYVGLSNVYLKDPARYAANGIRLLRQAVAVFPEDINFWNNLGFFLTHLGEHAEALEAFRRVVTLEPDFDLSRRNLRNALAQLGRRDDPALTALARLDELDRRVRAGDFGSAVLALAREAARDFPTSVKARLYLGNLLLLNGAGAEAEGELRWVIGRDPRHLPARKNLAVLYERLGRLADAVEAWRGALGVQPDDAEARQALQRLGASAPAPRAETKP